MLRVNLLPPEIIEKRKWDRYYPYVFISFGVSALVILLVWGFLQFGVSTKNEELQTLQEETADITAKSEKLVVFELRQQEMEQRKQTVFEAMNGRVYQGRLMEEISLVLPAEVWLRKLELDEAELGLEAYTPKVDGFGSNEQLEDGYKSAAATLFRLGSLRSLSNLWLDEAKGDRFNKFEPEESEVEVSPRVIAVKISGRVSPEPTATVSVVK